MLQVNEKAWFDQVYSWYCRKSGETLFPHVGLCEYFWTIVLYAPALLLFFIIRPIFLGAFIGSILVLPLDILMSYNPSWIEVFVIGFIEFVFLAVTIAWVLITLDEHTGWVSHIWDRTKNLRSTIRKRIQVKENVIQFLDLTAGALIGFLDRVCPLIERVKEEEEKQA